MRIPLKDLYDILSQLLHQHVSFPMKQLRLAEHLNLIRQILARYSVTKGVSIDTEKEDGLLTMNTE